MRGVGIAAPIARNMPYGVDHRAGGCRPAYLHPGLKMRREAFQGPIVLMANKKGLHRCDNRIDGAIGCPGHYAPFARKITSASSMGRLFRITAPGYFFSM